MRWMGIIGFVGFWLLKGVFHPLEKDWVELLIMLAVMVLVPIGMERVGVLKSQWEQYVVALASWLLLTAFMQEPGFLAAMLALPWLLVSLFALGQALQLFLLSKMSDADVVQFAAFVFLPIGAAWALSDRLAFAPLGFSPIIVLLTAAHFHYAGFLLPWITAALLRQVQASWVAKLLTGLIVVGIPAVAIGITASQLEAAPWIETLAATLMASGGLLLAIWHAKMALTQQLPILRRLGILGIFLCLGTGMILALLYGWRSYFPLPFLSIPWMYALHGSLNTLGVGVLGVLVWSSK